MLFTALLLVAAVDATPADRLVRRIETCRSHRDARTPPPRPAACPDLDRDLRRFLATKPSLDDRLTLARALSDWGD